MGLPSELISQLVKVTNDSTNNVDETTVYGTIVEYEGSNYVRLDGSELLTPITTAASVKPGERVTVMIKNHTATVTGNLSSPAARVTDVEETVSQISEFERVIAGKVDTKDLVAEQARIDALIAKDVEITGSLTAANAKIEELEADNVTITGKLEAAEAEIENLVADKITVDILDAKYAKIEDLEATNVDVHNLEATYAKFEVATANKFSAIDATIENLDVDNLDAKYAKIEDLEATNANVSNLGADIADIDTLIFGSASGDTIQTSFANAVIAQLGNAQIKSAMIDSISAGKIAAGDINTNNVRVVSEDGKLLISDETIQISDNTRVRVQIGKDATNDYSISIWDADGNLMFSEGGITGSAIKEAIIRNDMVSDTANIAASKLDISSLFTEINNSTQTINSSKILMDADNQTLDVVFTQMSSDIDGLSDDVSTQGTALSVVQGQISSKVWQQDIDTAIDGVDNDIDALDTKYSELNQEVDSISTTVSSHTTLIANKADSSEVAEVYATKTEVEQTAESITSHVSATHNETSERLTSAETTIQQLADSIVTLVTDSNGDSMLVQNGEGWTFSTSQIQNTVNSTAENLNSLVDEMGGVNSAVGALQQAVDDLGVLNDYVKIGTYEDEPCIELGESDSDFKLLITNTRIMFMEGSSVPAYINNQSLHIKKAVIEEELQQGEFIWKARSNGNLGLIWKGANS